mmetsp:Transcript_24556/g.44309  ORF Transcript_24556/g.44309 Transcript_24556/m.44309 type:complete len:543 (-) Transcript_24556:315-1943(-)|eukprot:CAMPEP_0196139214 /NCGR_PEP_ID=MMETSP0910-20130528/6573_1 /TAXON_ID=49265 /ORGANISM="Thalassiosira rotula, Strain GSO102" /LENGTH=542 /DNA_ID=CAMNT_0041399917 /DNA_START=18 /DNA_END=1646 /DNA_ORIENTATION=-
MAQVLVLYQITNELPPSSGGAAAHYRHGNLPPSYNAYYMPRKNGVTLANVKQSCRALQQLHPRGSDGYHWRVRIDEKPNTSHSSSGIGGGSSGGAYSWWDVQDENARLPVKEATPKELNRMLAPKIAEEGDIVTQEVTKAAKGAMKYMGKAMNAVSGSEDRRDREMEDDLTAVRTPVIFFKLLDLGKVRKGFGGNGGGATSGGSRRVASSGRPVPARRGASNIISSRGSNRSLSGSQQPPSRQSSRVSAAPISAGAPRVAAQQQQHQARTQPLRPPPSVAKSTPPTADLMGFNSAPAPAAQSRNLHHATSLPTTSTPTGAKPGETRAEKLKREYAKKQATASRVWDDIDKRWVEGPVKDGETKATAPSRSNAGIASSNGGVVGATTGVKGISLDRSNAAGKSANVAAAVHARINDMEGAQQKAIQELRAREAQKANADNEEDLVRQRLEPKLKAWGEEHGKKKQLRALLANLHTILWEGSKWKQVSLADVLDDSKVKRVYHKASRVVHPDKTGHLDAEKRFIAKRVFDALTQAKVEFDEGKG